MDAQEARGDYAVASTSHQGLSQKDSAQAFEDDKLTNGGRVLVVHTVDGKDAKGGKGGRRRGRFIILVDEGEERKRWVPWVLLALLIIAVGIAVYVIVYRLNGDNNTDSSTSGARRSSAVGKDEEFTGCGGGNSPLIGRLRDTAKLATIGHFEGVQSQWDRADTVWANSTSLTVSGTQLSSLSHDIIVPTSSDASTVEGDRQVSVQATARGYVYAVSGTELLVLIAQQNGSGVVQRLDFAELPAFQSQKELTLVNDTSAVAIPTGLGATFTANQILLPSREDNDVLLVIGSAVAAAPVIPGPTPNIIIGESTTRSFRYTHPTFRPFDSTVVIVVNISQPDQPVAHSVSEHEGQFISAIDEQSNWAWLFIRASAHVSADHDNNDDGTLDDSIMPLFRSISIDKDSELEAWQAVGGCADVRQLGLESERSQSSYILVAQPVNLDIAAGGGVSDPWLFVMGWSTQMLPVVPAKGTAEDSTLQLFLTEAVAAGSSAAASSTSSTASTASGEGASTLTALIRFNLTDGKMTFNGTESLDGDTTFRGAARFLPESQQLSLLLTDTLDASSDESLRSALYLFKTAPEFQQEYNNTDQFRDRAPTSIVYQSDSEGVQAAFVGFASGPQPIVQVLPMGSGDPDCTIETCPVLSIQRTFVSEQVSLMKGFTVEIEGREDSAKLLLVAGRQVAESGSAPAAASSPANAADPAASEAELQLSIYSYVPLDPASRMTRLTTMSIAPGRILSEAFQDERAAWLFHAPSAEGDPVLFFALPVGIVKDATELLKELGCTATDGFSGTLIWRIDAQATQGTDGIVSVSASIQRVAAVPSTGACGTPAGCSTACRHEQSMVKRIRLVGEDDELQFMTVSNCHTVSVPWASIAAATPETTLPTAGTTEPAVGAASEGNFTVIQGTSQQFSGREGQCGVAAV